MKEAKDLDSVIFKIVDEQIMLNRPPGTRMTFERLISMGFSEESTKNLIAGVLLSELQAFLNTEDDQFDIARYSQALDSLP